MGDNYVINSGFETGDFSNWSVGGTGTIGVTQAAAAHGNYGAAFDHSFGSLLQFVPTEAGAIYQLSFMLRSDLPPPLTFTVYWDGFATSIDRSTFTGTYTLYSSYLGISGHGGTTPLQFVFYQPDGGFMLDDVQVVMTYRPTAVPESGGTFWLLILSTAAIGMAKLVRRRATESAPEQSSAG